MCVHTRIVYTYIHRPSFYKCAFPKMSYPFIKTKHKKIDELRTDHTFLKIFCVPGMLYPLKNV